VNVCKPITFHDKTFIVLFEVARVDDSIMQDYKPPNEAMVFNGPQWFEDSFFPFVSIKTFKIYVGPRHLSSYGLILFSISF
jgi:hypothetical protein